MELIKQIGAFAGLASFVGLAVLAMLAFSQARDIRRLREWAGSAPERDAERKETTSAVAAKRAEELRALEDARTAEREAVDEREERRRRREAGLPEQTRSERVRESLSHFGSHLAEPRWLAALFAVIVAVAGGAVYVATQTSDNADGKGAPGRGAAVRPGEIEVTVLNGTAVPGLAAKYADKVEGKGFRRGAVGNSSSSFVDSVVMFEAGHGREAHMVASALGISKVRQMTSDIAAVSANAPVAVIIGEEDAAASG